MRWAWTQLVCLALLIVIAGCRNSAAQKGENGPQADASGPNAPEAVSTKPAADWTANEILKRLLATYREAKTYLDQAVVRLAFRQNGQALSQEQPNAVAFER